MNPLLAPILSLFAVSPWYEEKLEGWYYFQDRLQDEINFSQDEAEEILEGEKQNLKELLALALLIPTEENIKNFVREQNRWMDQSALFANQWKAAITPPVAKTHFLLFCFRGKDPASSAAWNRAKRFAEKNHWTLKAVSLDGQGMKGWMHMKWIAGFVGICMWKMFPLYTLSILLKIRAGEFFDV